MEKSSVVRSCKVAIAMNTTELFYLDWLSEAKTIVLSVEKRSLLSLKSRLF